MSKVIKLGVYEETSVYRYMPVERFLEIVENEQNTLSHISKWEDPNEAYLIRSRIVANAQRGDDARHFPVRRVLLGSLPP